eukprot:6196674-Pleurochrysis_carterae.AAC.2
MPFSTTGKSHVLLVGFYLQRCGKPLWSTIIKREQAPYPVGPICNNPVDNDSMATAPNLSKQSCIAFREPDPCARADSSTTRLAPASC